MSDHAGTDDLVTRQAHPALAPGYRTDLFVGPLSAPDRYELLGPPLPGGEGTTWRARYLGELDKPVQMAVKVLHRPDRAGEWPPAPVLAGWRDRLELLRTAHLPHVVRLLDVEPGLAPHLLGARDTASTVLVEMEWVEGPTLTEVIGGRPVHRATLGERLGWIRDLATAIDGLHGLDNAAVHRDVSPGNCIVTTDRGLVLIDLSTIQLPVDGADLLGRHTPTYSAPEVLAAPHARRAAAADRWAVGAIAYLCVTGAHPPRSAVQRAAGITAAVRALGAPRSAASTVLAMLDDDPASRPGDVTAWAAQLERELRRSRRRGAKLALPIAGLAAAGVAAALVLPAVLTPAVRSAAASGTGHAPTAATGDPAAVISPAAAPSTPISSTSAALAGTIRTASAVISDPEPGAAVGTCVMLRGNARLPAGRTIVLTVRRAEGGSIGEPYTHYPLGFPEVTGATAFSGGQWFNEQSYDQHFRLDVVEVDLAAAKAQYEADHPSIDYRGDAALVARGTVLDSVTVVHRASAGDGGDCTSG